MNKRIDYFDIAKALLILCLLWGHYVLISRFQGIRDDMTIWMGSLSKLYTTFFMQSFFIITGLCTTFNIGFKAFLWKNIKTILIPGLFLCFVDRFLYNSFPGVPFEHTPTFVEWFVDGSPWFIMALFWAKLLYWFIVKLKIRSQIIICSVLYLAVLVMEWFISIPNYLWFKHALLMLPYLCLGHLSYQYLDRIESKLYCLSLIGGLILLFEFIFSLPMPFNDYYIGVSLKVFPIHIINVISGTLFILGLSKFIGHSKIIQTIGKGTLLIYLLNEFVIKVVVVLAHNIYPFDTSIKLVVYHIGSYFICIFIFYLLVILVYKTRYLSWIVGKY